MSEDGLTWDFVLRDGVKFHDGEPVTAEDVKFSFERYRGANQALIKDQVAAIETPDARHVRFKLNKPWPDFLTFYSSASGAGWIVPKKYVEKVGDDGFKKHPIGAGPYKFVSFTPGIELVLEAFEGYWRKSPGVKRIVMKSIPDETTRLAALKHGEIDIAYSIRGELAEELQRTPGLSLKSIVLQATNWIYFPEQWDPKSPWHDLRVRQAANLALDRDQMNQALFLGGCKINNSIIPAQLRILLAAAAARFTIRQRRRSCWPQAGFPDGFDAGPFTVDSSYSNMGEVGGELSAAGRYPLQAGADGARRLCLGFRQQEAHLGDHSARRAARSATPRRGSPRSSSRAAPTSMAAIPTSTSSTRSRPTNSTTKKRAAILEKMQRLVHEKAIDAPIWELAFLNGVGPRVGESSLGKIPGFPYTAPFEDITMKGA